MSEYYCKKCSYKFSKAKDITRCPYCSAVGTVSRVMDAQEILDESDEINEMRESRQQR